MRSFSERYTIPETNIAPKNGWLEYHFPIQEAYFQGRTVSFREGIYLPSRNYPQNRVSSLVKNCSALTENTTWRGSTNCIKEQWAKVMAHLEITKNISIYIYIPKNQPGSQVTGGLEIQKNTAIQSPFIGGSNDSQGHMYIYIYTPRKSKDQTLPLG